jgi:pimeloyl-ACP methyl ester carboxylesterase
VVEGRLTGIPDFVEDDQRFSLADDLTPQVIGQREAPFRVMIPAGTADYRFVMFGHGMGGSFHDRAFDGQLAALGIAKVGVDFYGFTQDELVGTFLTFVRVFSGTHRATARLIQAISDGAAIQAALSGVLGDALAADTIGGLDNPAKGRHVDTSVPIWTGGSLGGTAGMVYAIAHPELHHGVLNVPGAAWTHFLTQSSLYGLVEGLLANDVGGRLDLLHLAVMAQTNLDPVDGAVWAAELETTPKVFLIQESVGDPVLPNIGSEMVAVSTGAVQVGVPIRTVPGLLVADEAVGRTGYTQFKVQGDDDLAVHGFADRDTPAGAAARGQIDAFLQSVWAGAARIDVPAGCLAAHADGSCDFSADP